MAKQWPPPLVVETLSNITWRVSRLYYAYLPADNDAALGRCIKLARHSVVVVIVPRCHRWLKERLLAAVLRRRDPGTVSLGNFISWRTISAAIDQRWPEERATLRLLAAYNRRVRAAGTGDLALLVDAPHEP